MKLKLLSYVCLCLMTVVGIAQEGAKMRWTHEPKQWSAKDGVVTAMVDPGTDFWRVTHYGFIRDNGPFYFQEQDGDFEASVRVTGKYRELYHQAGLMVRVDEKNWIKTGIEYVNGVQNVSAVVTREFSDWSVVPRKESRVGMAATEEGGKFCADRVLVRWKQVRDAAAGLFSCRCEGADWHGGGCS